MLEGRAARKRSIMDNSSNSNPVFWLLLIGFVSWASGWGPFRNSTPIFLTYCSADLVAGVCNSQELTGPKVTYRVDNEQTVTFWGDDKHPSKYSNCAIADYENWSCINPSSTFSPAVVQMSDGMLRTSYSPDVMPSPASVSRWHWWRVWLDEARASRATTKN